MIPRRRSVDRVRFVSSSDVGSKVRKDADVSSGEKLSNMGACCLLSVSFHFHSNAACPTQEHSASGQTDKGGKGGGERGDERISSIAAFLFASNHRSLATLGMMQEVRETGSCRHLGQVHERDGLASAYTHRQGARTCPRRMLSFPCLPEPSFPLG